MKELLVDCILSHKINEGNCEFYVSVNNSHSMLWISESYLQKYHFNLLETYKKCHKFNNELGNQSISSEPDIINYSKFIALNFNEEFGIKLEIGVRETELEDDILDCIPSPGATTYLINPIQDFKSESMELPSLFDSNSVLNSNIHTTGDYLCDESLECTNNIQKNENDIAKNNMDSFYEFEQINGNDNNNPDFNVEPAGSLEVISVLENNFENHISNETVNGNNKENTICKETILFNQSEINETINSLSKKSSIGKVRKARKNIENKNLEQQIKTAKNLLSNDLEGTNRDTIDELFMLLPVTTKIVLDVDKLSENKLSPITLDILKSIINKGDIDLLQSYLNSNHRENLERLVQSQPGLFVLAAQYNHVHIVGSFLAMGVDINSIDAYFCNALMRACENENLLLIEFLVNNGAAINARPDGSNRVLLHCCLKNKIRSLTSLLNLGANFNEIQFNPPCSLEKYAKEMALNEISQILEKHISNLSKFINENVLSLLGHKVKILDQIMPINVLSLFEIENESIHLTFDADIPPVKSNHCNILFLVTGIVVGNAMKLLLSDSNKIHSLLLNGVEQQSLIPGSYNVVTSFSPLKGENNSLILNYDKINCRKIRLILVAYNVMMIE